MGSIPQLQSDVDSVGEGGLISVIREEKVTQDIIDTNTNVRATLMNLEKLACSDSEMIQLQRKAIYV